VGAGFDTDASVPADLGGVALRLAVPARQAYIHGALL
jgi:hypothetical protein